MSKQEQKERRTRVLSVRVRPSLADALDRHCERTDTPKARLIQHAISSAISQSQEQEHKNG